ncbi:MAG: sensor histidine kinase [Actinomycetes bacterium]
MRRRILQLAMAVCVVSVALFALPLGLAVHQNALSEERAELERHALRVAVALDPDQLSRPLPSRVVAGDETVAAYDDSGTRRSGTGPLHDPLVTQALRSQTLAYSHSEDAVTVALPVLDGDRVVAAVRLQTQDLDVWRRSWRTWLGLAALAAVALAVGLLVAWRLATRLARPLQHLEAVATRLGSGDFSVRSASSGIPEIDSVGQSLDSTAARLDDLVETERRLTRDASHQLRTPLTGLRLRLETGLAGPPDELPEAVTAALERLDVVDATMSDLLEGHRPAPPAAPIGFPNAAAVADAGGKGARRAAGAGPVPGASAGGAPGPAEGGSGGRAASSGDGATAVASGDPVEASLPGSPAALPASVVADEVARRWGPELTLRGRHLVVTDQAAPSTTATLAALRQALDVLVDNAVVHGEGEVAVVLRDAHGALAIDVVDQGPGVALADDVLFEHGTTTRPSGKGGLGLALARRLVESQGGRLLVRRPVATAAPASSGAAPGAWFTVIVPAADLEEDSPC